MSLKTHSLSNHLLLEDDLIFRFITTLILKQRFAVVIRIFSTASREVLTFLSGLLSIRKSCIILCIAFDCSAVLNLSEESLSQINC